MRQERELVDLQCDLRCDWREEKGFATRRRRRERKPKIETSMRQEPRDQSQGVGEEAQNHERECTVMSVTAE